MTNDILIYTCANNGYEDFAPLFVATALWANATAFVEFGMPDPSRFENDAAIAFLRDRFPERFELTSVDFGNSTLPHTVRFISQPKNSASYIYIIDSDLLILDRRFPANHLAFMENTGLPYANSVRDRDRRMTGLHFSRWDAYFPLPDISDLPPQMNDEQVLAEMVHRKGFPLYERPWFRPVPGIHPSPNRDPLGLRVDGRRIPGWGVEPWLAAWAQFRTELAPLIPLLVGISAEVARKLDEICLAKDVETAST
jgi:hypothetical protein